MSISKKLWNFILLISVSIVLNAQEYTYLYRQEVVVLLDSADKYIGKDDSKIRSLLEEAHILATSKTDTIQVFDLPHFEFMLRHRNDVMALSPAFWIKSASFFRTQPNQENAAAYAFIKAADLYRISNQLDSALRYSDSSLRYALIRKNPSFVSGNYNMQGIIAKSRSNYTEAKRNFRASMSFAKALNEKSTYCRGLIEFSNLFTLPQQADSVFFYLNEALRTAKEVNSETLRGLTLRTIALNYSKIDEHDSALHYIQKAIPIVLTTDTMSIATIYQVAAIINIKRSDYSRTEMYIDSSKYFAAKTQNRLYEPALLILRAELMARQGEWLDALPMFKEAIQLFSSFGDVRGAQKNKIKYLDLVQRANSRNLAADCLYYYEEVLNELVLVQQSTALPLGDRQQIIKANAWLLNFKGKGSEAYSLVKSEYDSLIERYNNELVNKRLQVESVQTLAAREKQLKQEELNSQQLASEALFNKVAAIAVLIVLVLLLLLFVVYRSKNKQKREKLQLQQEVNVQRIALAEKEIGGLSKEVSQNKKELTAFTLEVINKNNLLREMSANLKKARTEQDFSNIERELNLGLKEKKDWTEFRERFEKVDPQFIEKLKAKYPELTSGQIRLASLIKLGFSSKQIAEFLNNTPASVDVARSKLRKKLKIDSEIDISKYLLNI